MSEQAKIIEEMHSLVMSIITTGNASEEQADRMDALEAKLYEQNCFKAITHESYSLQGEEIASFFFAGEKDRAIEKMIACEISPQDFFGFIEYFYDEDHEDEEKIEIFTSAFVADVQEAYLSKQQ